MYFQQAGINLFAFSMLKKNLMKYISLEIDAIMVGMIMKFTWTAGQ
jgi:hypothetical protein